MKALEQQFSVGVNKNLRMRGLSNAKVTAKLLFNLSYTLSNRMAELYDEHFYSPRVEPKDRPVRMDSLRITPNSVRTAVSVPEWFEAPEQRLLQPLEPAAPPCGSGGTSRDAAIGCCPAAAC